MNSRKHGLKAFGLSILVALGVLGSGAAAAQASHVGLFSINNSTANLLATATGGIAGTFVTLLSTVNGVPIEVRCSAITFLAGSEIINNTEGLVILRYDGCVLLLKNSLPTEARPGGVNCRIYDEDEFGNKIEGQILAKVKLTPILVLLGNPVQSHKLLILASGDFEVEPGVKILALIASENCNIPNHARVSGSVVLLLSNETAITQTVTEAASAIQAVLGDGLKYSKQTATLDGSATVSLAGAHLNKTWGSV